jgi:hypothetical protein
MRTKTIKNALPCIALASAIVLPINNARANTDSERTAFEFIYQRVAQDLKQNNAKDIFSFETDDFSHKILSGKTLNHQEADAILQQSMNAMKVSDAETTIADFSVEKEQATIVVTQKIVAILKDPKDKEHKLIDVSKSRDSWIKVDGKWKIKFSEDLDDSATIDGNPVQ